MSELEGAARKLNSLLNGAAQTAEDNMQPAKPIQATVSNITDDGVYVKTDGDNTQKGPFKATIMPKIGDRVGITNIGGTWTVTDDYDDPGASGTFVQQETGKVVVNVDEIRAGVGKFDDIYGANITASIIISDRATANEMEAARVKAEEIGANLVVATEGQFESILADSVTAEDVYVDGQLVANIARIDYGELNDLNANVATFGQMGAKFAQVDFANINGAKINAARMAQVFAGTGWFNEVEVTGDASITGQLKSVLIDGNTARFKNIYAEALKLLGNDGLYHALNIAGLSSEDAAAMIEAYGESLDGGLHGSHLIAESVTATQIDVTTLVTAMLLTQAIQIGATGGIHIESNGNRLSFLSGNYHIEEYVQVTPESGDNPQSNGWYVIDDGQYVLTTDTTVQSGTTYYRVGADDANTPLPGEVAYIAVDERGESMFYITREFVVKELRIGSWTWSTRSNGNLSLKWVG